MKLWPFIPIYILGLAYFARPPNYVILFPWQDLQKLGLVDIKYKDSADNGSASLRLCTTSLVYLGMDRTCIWSIGSKCGARVVDAVSGEIKKTGYNVTITGTPRLKQFGNYDGYRIGFEGFKGCANPNTPVVTSAWNKG